MAESNFIDYVRIFCASGHGGAGSAHLHRAKYVPKGGPDGGDGGRGGHIILRVNPQLWTLIHLRYRKVVRAENGGNGAEALKRGKNGTDIVLEVPQGVVVKDAETEEIITELVEPGQEYILCQGGRGGWGNDHFKSPTNQTPRYAQPGEEGVEGWFILELKVLADVGLVGFPNALRDGRYPRHHRGRARGPWHRNALPTAHRAELGAAVHGRGRRTGRREGL